MEANFVKNLRDVIKASSRTDIDDIGVMPPQWLFDEILYHARITHDRHDYSLKPPILVPPMYHVNAPMPVRLGTFGVEVAKATIQSYQQLRFEGHRTELLDRFHSCFGHAARKERTEAFTPEWIESMQKAMLDSTALDAARSVLQLTPSYDEDRLRYVPLTGHQLFYVAHCYTHLRRQGRPDSVQPSSEVQGGLCERLLVSDAEQHAIRVPVQGLLTGSLYRTVSRSAFLVWVAHSAAKSRAGDVSETVGNEKRLHGLHLPPVVDG
ncbi:uncharacterized protein LOC142591399 [Dermacentor variabilis]|uniref:uncharacterized protein LOC142591399 n=1 Tax=Dermacentor variabilis TaxID=34621 RepID=UPI003F5CA782